MNYHEELERLEILENRLKERFTLTEYDSIKPPITKMKNRLARRIFWQKVDTIVVCIAGGAALGCWISMTNIGGVIGGILAGVYGYYVGFVKKLK